MNRYAHQDLVIKQAQQQRRNEVEYVTYLAAESKRKLEEAVAWVRRMLPDLCEDGEPCPYAVHGALSMRSMVGEGNVTAAMVRDWRERYMIRWGAA